MAGNLPPWLQNKSGTGNNNSPIGAAGQPPAGNAKMSPKDAKSEAIARRLQQKKGK